MYGPPAVVQGGTADDVIARKLETESEVEVKSNATETETATEVEATSAHEVTKRNTNDKGIFTRRGAYNVIESRLNA